MSNESQILIQHVFQYAKRNYLKHLNAKTNIESETNVK